MLSAQKWLVVRYVSSLKYSAEGQSAQIPDREAHVDDRLGVVIMESDLKHSAVREWMAHIVRIFHFLGASMCSTTRGS